MIYIRGSQSGPVGGPPEQAKFKKWSMKDKSLGTSDLHNAFLCGVLNVSEIFKNKVALVIRRKMRCKWSLKPQVLIILIETLCIFYGYLILLAKLTW